MPFRQLFVSHVDICLLWFSQFVSSCQNLLFVPLYSELHSCNKQAKRDISQNVFGWDVKWWPIRLVCTHPRLLRRSFAESTRTRRRHQTVSSLQYLYSVTGGAKWTVAVCLSISEKKKSKKMEVEHTEPCVHTRLYDIASTTPNLDCSQRSTS